ncbi:nucleotidyltransferase domain-containing protein [Erysipelotrichaceae bacterium OttesenSCG-928-M19]|nr:nucleotidyltransferase domain-containing protein [Erysipelotrichaceae bacterium OttesenSCG-928-M19]
MENKILFKLKEIEKQENVKIIYAVESGSRAWGFASPDSDYDVRFIYIREHKDYLRLDEMKDTIEWQLDETLDINGWDLKKALKLLYKANPTLYEWNSSVIIYRESKEWKEVTQYFENYYNAKAMLYHYYKMALSNYQANFKGNEIIIKKYLYVLRPLLASQWIINKNSIPPILFADLVESELPKELRVDVSNLLKLKEASNEKEKMPRIIILDNFIEQNLIKIKQYLDNMEVIKSNDYRALNELFYKLVRGKNNE